MHTSRIYTLQIKSVKRVLMFSDAENKQTNRSDALES